MLAERNSMGNFCLAMKLDLKIPKSDSEPSAYKPPEYPTFSYTTDEEHSLPEDGSMKITYHKTRSEEVEEDGKTKYRCTVEVRSIDNVKGGKGKAKDDDAGGDDEEMEEGAGEEASEAAEPKKGAKKGKRSPAVEAVLGRGEY